jgi:uncharacterized protein (DUF2345 family)
MLCLPASPERRKTMYQLPKHTLPRAAHLWLTAALLAALVCSLTPQRVLPAAARPEGAAPPASRSPSFDYAQDKPFDYAQDRPFDCAQDRPFDCAQDRPFDPAQDRSFAAWPPGLAATLAQALQDELPAAYNLSITAAGYRAENPAHNLQLDFTPAGLQVRSPSADWQWDLSLRALGYAGAVQPVPPADLAAGRTRLEYRRGPALTEWYLNSPWGLEQGFTLAAPPVASPGGGQRAGLVLELALGGSLTPRLEGATVLLAEGSGQVVARYTGLTAWDAGGRQLPASLSVAPHTIAILVDDSAARYPLTIDPWVQLAKLTASDGAANDYFGASVAISGDTVVVGAYGDDSYKGSAYVFVRPGGGWATTSTYTARLTASDGAAGDQFGASVAISGDTVVVGAYYDDIGGKDNQGSAYVFVRPGGGWVDMTETARLTASDGAAGDQFGASVAISGDTVVVGAPYDDGYKGSAYVFVRPAGVWATTSTYTARLTASDRAANDYFGASVAISGDTVVVGAYGDDSEKGSAYVFVRPVGGWVDMTETAKLTASDGEAGDRFGYSVAISGDTVVVGAYGDDIGSNADQGSAYVFVRPGGGWVTTSTYTAKLTASDGAAEDYFGASVAISGDTVVVGALGDDIGSNADQGSAYIFGNLGSIIVDKVTNPGGDPASFAFTLTGGPSNLNQSFNLTDATPPYDSGAVLPGSGYKVTETVPSGWNLTGATCSDGSPPDNVDLSAGETVTCTFTNTKQGHIVVDKVTNPGGDPASFAFTLSGGPSNLNQSFNLTDAAPPYNSGAVLPGSGYKVTETVPSGWSLTSAACSDGSPLDNVDLSAGETVTCTFTNTKQVTLTVNRTGTGSGTVTSNPAGINCGADCTETYNGNTVVALTATPAAGSSFAGWSGDCSGTDPTTSVTMNADKTCTATFNKAKLQPVGGYLVPVRRAELWAPWLGLALLASLAAVTVTLVRWRRG